MDEHSKKAALRMIPYGLYVLTAARGQEVAAATVNWVTQVAFQPPLLALGVKVGSGVHSLIKDGGYFALNFLKKGQQSMAFVFFKPTQREGNTINGVAFSSGTTGSPVLEDVPAYVECRLVDTIEKGDHSVFVGEVVEAVVREMPEGRPDEAILTLKDLGDNVFYGG